jgi:hypothetical protein
LNHLASVASLAFETWKGALDASCQDLVRHTQCHFVLLSGFRKV